MYNVQISIRLDEILGSQQIFFCSYPKARFRYYIVTAIYYQIYIDSEMISRKYISMSAKKQMYFELIFTIIYLQPLIFI